ncbi:MAG: CYTH domain-containing protein [Gemmatimonadaceae bacterium]
MRETELKGLVPDEAAAIRRLEQAGATLSFDGSITDRRFDTPDRALFARDEVLRIRVTRGASGVSAQLDLKGPTSYEDGYKHRDEMSLAVGDGEVCAALLARLGYVVTREIDRAIRVYEVHGAHVRLERYPRMDVLVEVEGTAASIEAAIQVLQLERDGFTTERVSAFVRRYEARTGQRAAISEREARGDFRDSLDDA